jgi:malonyl-CoA O-methyltransferase
MMRVATPRVARAFDAAVGYAEHATVQRRVATTLARRIAALPVVAARERRPRLLEIGCGTGFLTQALLDEGLGGDWLVTDIAPAMLRRCAATLAARDSSARLDFAVMDGAWPADDLPRGGFDLVCSSLAFQWLDDLPGALSRLAPLLAPGGALAFTTLVAGTFAEWETAHRALGLASGGLAYPDLERLASSFPPGGTLSLGERSEREDHASARAFLRSVKRIGAASAPEGRRPLPPAALRRVMAGFDAAGARATYRVATCVWTRDGAA